MKKITVIHDLNNLMARNLYSKEIYINSEDPNYDLWEFQMFDQIYRSSYKFKATEMILAVDAPSSWRKVAFPRYKEERIKKRNADEDVDWNLIFEKYENFYTKIKKSLPFKVIKVSRSEGDDIIGVLAKYIDNDVIIISNDQDYLQLTDDKSIKVYSPTKQEFLSLNGQSRKYLMEKLCLMGQTKDGIFNVKTPNDYPVGMRKPPLGEKTAEKIIEKSLSGFLSKKIKIDKDGYKKEFTPIENYERNKLLIDFNYIPDIIKDSIERQYNNYKLADPKNIFEYFKSYGWTWYMDEFDKVEQYLMKFY